MDINRKFNELISKNKNLSLYECISIMCYREMHLDINRNIISEDIIFENSHSNFGLNLHKDDFYKIKEIFKIGDSVLYNGKIYKIYSMSDPNIILINHDISFGSEFVLKSIDDNAIINGFRSLAHKI